MDAVASAVSQLGFPVAIAIYFVYLNGKQTDKYIELAKQASLDSRASTESIERSSEIIQKNTEAFLHLSGVLDGQR